MEKDTKKVISVMSFNSVMEAQLYKALLESAGIPARMQNDLAAQVMPAYGALMQINLLVAEENQKKAREILGAKFDIDEFHRQTAGPAKKLVGAGEDAPKKRGRKPGVKKEGAPAKKAPKAAVAAKPIAKKTKAEADGKKAAAKKPAEKKTPAKTADKKPAATKKDAPKK